MRPSTVFIKLGGSLITDKTRAYTARAETIARLAGEVRCALDAAPGLRLLIGHGSGSFGHWIARTHGTRQGVRTPAQWRGYAEVAAAAARLNRVVADAFLAAGVPTLLVQPSASARCNDGVLEYLDTQPLHNALERGLVPLVYGDVAPDRTRGGTIISTEDIFVFLAAEFRPTHIFLLGEVAGVLDAAGAPIPRITPDDFSHLRPTLDGVKGVDVTGGMLDKVTRMLELAQRFPDMDIRILSGAEPGLLSRLLLDPTTPAGTRVASVGVTV